MLTSRQEPLLVQCEARESGGVRCEVLLARPGEEHRHWISEATIYRSLGYGEPPA